MVKKIFFITCIISIPLMSTAQTFTEITEAGWGQGMKDNKIFVIDLDNDGLLDMLIGQYNGSLYHYEQDTENTTDFTMISRQFSAIDVGRFAAPVFTDLDNDGLFDLIIGESDGNLNHYEQVTTDADSFVLITEEFNSIDVGDKSIPSFIDLDQDGLQDLILSSQDGTMYHYEQDAADPLVFTLISDNFSNIDAGFFGTVCFTDLDHDNLYDMITGSNSGYLKHYEQDSLGSTTFSLISDNFYDFDAGANEAAHFADLDNDDLLDLMVGSGQGYINHYTQDSIDATTFSLSSENFLGVLGVDYYSTPCFADLDNDGLMDMVVGEYFGTLYHYEQDAVGSETFNLITDNFNDIDIGRNPVPCFVELNNDDLLDLIIGTRDGDLHYYTQEENGSTHFVLVSDSLSDISVGNNSAPSFTDLDNDGLLDMIVGNNEGTLNHFEQNALASTEFTPVPESFNDLDVGTYSSPHFTDLDDDDLLDLIVGYSSNTLLHYEQETAGSNTFSLVSDNFLSIVQGRNLSPVCIDINNDGLEDLIVGENYGGIYYFQREQDTAVEDNALPDPNPASFKLFSNYPNPFNPVTTIHYNLQKAVTVQLSIHNTLGQTVKILENDFQPAGSHSIQWDGKDKDGRSVTSGIYICQMQAGEFKQSIKIMLIR